MSDKEAPVFTESNLPEAGYYQLEGRGLLRNPIIQIHHIDNDDVFYRVWSPRLRKWIDRKPLKTGAWLRSLKRLGCELVRVESLPNSVDLPR